MRSPSSGISAGMPPALVRTEGRMVLAPGERCQTTKRLAGRSRGSREASLCSASMPPAEAPITTMSFLAIPSGKQVLDLLHEQDDAVAPLICREERRAGDAALDLLAAPVHGIEQHLLARLLAAQAGS